MTILGRFFEQDPEIESDMEFFKNFHRRIFRLKISYRRFHLILIVLVRKNTKNKWKWRILHRWQKYYTGGIDKFHLWIKCRQNERESAVHISGIEF